MLLLNKGEKACQKFVCEVLKNSEVEKTFPRLEELDWTSLDSKPEPEGTPIPDEDPRYPHTLTRSQCVNGFNVLSH